jgi:signal peptidase I
VSDLLLNVIKEKIKQVGSASLKLSGHSMYPTISNGDEITIEFYKFEDVQINDIVACYFENLKHFIIHRVISIENIQGKRVLITKGDNNDHMDAKAVKQHNFVGIARVEKTESKTKNASELAPNVLYFKDRDCVLKCDDVIDSLSIDILPPVTNRVTKKINRALTTELIILLSYRCNLNCIYCSNNSGENNEINITTKAENIVNSITYVVKNELILRKIKSSDSIKPARIIVSGGGEPTVEWNLLALVVDTVKSFKNKYGNDIAELSILTNAQINDEKADYLIRNFDAIAISCDGFSTQDKQRPRINGDSSKKYVVKFLEKLNSSNKEVSIRMTVTGEALPYLQDDVDYFLSSFKVIKNVIIEPFVQVGRGADNNIKKLDYDDFVFEFDAVVRKHYKNVYNSVSLLEYANAYPCQRLSGISLVLSPYNVITCCDTVTPESELWESMIVASFEDKKIKILNEYVHSIPDVCKSCVALNFCAGGCPMHLSSLSDNEKEELCKYKRDMVKAELLRRVEFSKKTKNLEYGGINYSVYSLPRSVL